MLNSVSDVVARGALLTQIAQRFAVNEEELRQTMTTPDPSRLQQSPRITTKEERLSGQAVVEAELIQLMLVDRNAALCVADEEIVPTFQYWEEMANEIIVAWRQSEHLDLSEFLTQLPRKMADQVSRAYGRPHTEEDEAARQRLLFDCVMKIRRIQARKLGKNSCYVSYVKRNDAAMSRRCIGFTASKAIGRIGKLRSHGMLKRNCGAGPAQLVRAAGS